MQERQVILDLLDFGKELFRQLGILFPLLNPMRQIHHPQLSLNNLFIMVNGVLHQPIDILYLPFQLILRVFQSIIKRNHLGFNLINRGSRGVFE